MSDRYIPMTEPVSVDEAMASLRGKVRKGNKRIAELESQLTAANARVEALQAERQWIPVSERLPDEEEVVLVTGKNDDDSFMDFDAIEDGVWVNHYNNFEHFQAVGGVNAIPGEVSTGPSEDAPYTHWMPLPNPPEQEKGE